MLSFWFRLLALIVCTWGDSASAVTITAAPQPAEIIYDSSAEVSSRNASFRCAFESNVTVNVTWSRVGSSVLKQSHTITSTSNSSVLTILSIVVNDTDEYKCTLQDASGNVSATANLTVSVKPSVALAGSATFVEGSLAILDCTVRGSPPPDVSWKRETQAANGTLQSNNSLSIESITRQEAGNFSCIAENSVGSASGWVNVQVYFSPTITSFPGSTPKVVVGEQLSVVCQASGLPQPHVAITLNGKNLANGSGKATISTSSAGTNDGGSYLCTATNSAGTDRSNVDIIILSKPSPPRNLQYSSKTSKSIAISWSTPTDNGNSEIKSYTISYSSNSHQPMAISLDCPADCSSLSKNITGLISFTQYGFHVVARNDIGVSDESVALFVTTSESAPTASPTALTLNISSANQIDVSWIAPEKQFRNGIIMYYTIAYTVDGAPKTEKETPSNATVYTLKPVFPGRLYVVTVSAATVAGSGPPSPPAQIRAAEKVPDQPANVTVDNGTAPVSLAVSWQPPSTTNGNITGYRVKLVQISRGSVQLPLTVTRYQNTTNLSTVLENLDYFSSYHVSVAARTSAGFGPYSSNITVLTVEGVPTAVRNLSVLHQGATFTYLLWVPPQNAFGHILFYRVQQLTPDGVETNVTCSNGIDPFCNVTSLSPFTNYQFSVYAVTAAGLGEVSTINHKTDSSAPPAPTNISQSTATSPTTFTVPLEKVPDTNGIIKYYQIIVQRLSSSSAPQFRPSNLDQSTWLDYEANSLLNSPRSYYIAMEFSSSEFDSNNPFVVGNGARSNRTSVLRLRRSTSTVFYNAPLPSGTHFTGFQAAFVSDTIYSTSDWFEPVQTSPAPVENTSVGTGTIVAIVIAVVLVTIVLVVVFVILLKRRRENKNAPDHEDGSMGKHHRNGTVKRDPRVPIPAERFEEHVTQLKANSHFGFSQEYLMISRELVNPYNIALKPENNAKNRYANVPAYDHSRVILQNSPDGDYINANYIEGLDNDREYIATQGPLPEYCHDFWTMIWEQNVATIVMLTRLEEKNRVKCAQYWSDNGPSTFKAITVTPMERHDFPDITMRTFHVTKTGQTAERNIKQYHFLAWPDFGVPGDTSAILSLIKRVNSWNPPDAGPIVVHCSAGVGRTGTYVAIDTNIKRIEKQEDISVFMNVFSIRDQRCLMVQTEDQYIFIHDALLEYIESGKTEVSAEDLSEYIKQQSQTDPQTAVTGLMQEFLRLAKTNPENKYAEANKPCNQMKNRYKNVYPYDETRVKLVQKPGMDGSDFINANYIDGYAGKNSFIATQAPLPETISDFWRMMWEQNSLTIVMLSKEEEAGKLKVVPYWPANEAMKIEQFLIELVSTNQHGEYLVRDLKVTNAMEGSSRVVRQYQYIAWPENGSPDSGSGMINLIGQVQKWNSSVGNRIVTVHCSAGVGRTGVFIALTNLIERLKMEALVDVYHAVKKMRQQRTAMVQTRDQYEFCYSALQEYLDSFDLYGNFK